MSINEIVVDGEKMQCNNTANSMQSTNTTETMTLISKNKEIEEKKRKLTLPLATASMSLDLNQNQIDADQTKRCRTQQTSFDMAIDTPTLLQIGLMTPDFNRLLNDVANMATPMSTNTQLDLLNRLSQATDEYKRDSAYDTYVGPTTPDSTYATLTSVATNSFSDKKTNGFTQINGFPSNIYGLQLKTEDKSVGSASNDCAKPSIMQLAVGTQKDELLHTVPIHTNQLTAMQHKQRNSRKSSNSSASSPTRSLTSYKMSSSDNADNDNNDKFRIDKKRERNREAARKCRTRKLEKIASLEKQVKDLKDKNSFVAQETHTLRDEINTLREKLMQHKRLHGCDISLNL
jgi:hypothetical protein